MKSKFIAKFINKRLARVQRHTPDFVIGADPANPYMRRWYIIPHNPFFNIYLHRVLRSDDDRALHDHPWPSLSIMLQGCLCEIYKDSDGNKSRFISSGDIVFRRAAFAHRLIVLKKHAVTKTLFITGPKIREWGFLCPHGWRHWKDFVARDDSGKIGRGCE